ncbi:alpha-ribazole phosphatase family protein [Acidiphilium sp.]|uniref:alpha-ribazole phosphatase family protein n=1 Tax=Acidiphilium sp. TaxID=527 RepID=UPI003CFE7753
MIALVRHPQPDIAPGICYGRLDVGLSAEGHAAIAPIVARLADHPAPVIWTSPARRCNAVAQALGVARRRIPHVEPRLRELDFGAWEGRAWDDVPRSLLDHWAADPLGFAPPGGESGAALLARVGEVHAALSAQGTSCIVVAHGGPLKLLAALLRGAPPDLLATAPPLGSITLIAMPAPPMPPRSAQDIP